jgi:tRNA 2-thiocytidine biosynthesis protein TtcA
MQRQVIKEMLQQWDKSHPGRIETIFTSIANVSLSQLADTKNFPFAELQTLFSDSNELNVVELV